ncbi:ribosome maturation factor RimP [Knoellia remsis]|uniref:Ribosome maturation factor RimP n=1 Tax=Knoellia remsis TaxID=407159 RepID=A0A2T0UZN8_9MICO|nr:ribosome maturation factor RimP [Knoellia remsis]PRY63400.1 ribosome maturation factor RimP [Knoellia remsis]
MTRDTGLQELLDGALAGSGLVVDEVTVTPAGRRRVVKVVVDRELPDVGADGFTEMTEPLSLDEIADATRTVSDALDDSDVLGEQSYTLEVTSPGVSRPLTQPRHFQRNVGRLVTVQLRDGDPVTGRITRASADDVVVTVPAAKKSPARDETIPYAAIDRAEVQVEFARKDDKES